MVSDAKERNLCFDFQKGTCTRGDDCPWVHEKQKLTPKAKAKASAKPGGGKGRGKGKKGKSRSNSPKPNKDTPCPFLARGHCKMGDKCGYKHE